jgi:ribose/xylose/arabinose/galactoside ABC-type transport system permease subunit
MLEEVGAKSTGSKSASLLAELGRRAVFKELGLALAFAILIVSFASASSTFLTSVNVWEVLRNASLVGIVALGVSFPLLCGEIDVSVGSIVGVAGMLAFNSLTVWGWPWWAAIAVGIATGAGLGALNGFCVVRLALPSVLVTLGALTAYRGLTRVLSSKREVAALGITDQTYTNLGGGNVGPVPIPFLFLCGFTLLAWYVLSKTKFGLMCRAVGGNRLSARRAGLPVKRVVMVAFIVSGAAAGLTAVLLTSLLTTSLETLGEGYEFQAISAAAIGGVSLLGGIGEVRGVFLGVMFIAFLTNGLILVGLPPEFNSVVTGSVLIAAVAVDEGVRIRLLAWKARGAGVT